MSKEKDLVIRLADAEQELVDAVNRILQKNALPFFLFEPIMDKTHRLIMDGKNAEMAAAREKGADAGKVKFSKEGQK